MIFSEIGKLKKDSKSDNYLQKHRNEILNAVKSEILNDSRKLFSVDHPSSLLFQDSIETDEITSLMDDLLPSVDDMCSIFTELVVRYLKVVDNQYRKTLLVLFGKRTSQKGSSKTGNIKLQDNMYISWYQN